MKSDPDGACPSLANDLGAPAHLLAAERAIEEHLEHETELAVAADEAAHAAPILVWDKPGVESAAPRALRDACRGGAKNGRGDVPGRSMAASGGRCAFGGQPGVTAILRQVRANPNQS